MSRYVFNDYANTKVFSSFTLTVFNSDVFQVLISYNGFHLITHFLSSTTPL